MARVDLKDPCENSAFLRERNLGLLKMRKLDIETESRLVRQMPRQELLAKWNKIEQGKLATPQESMPESHWGL